MKRRKEINLVLIFVVILIFSGASVWAQGKPFPREKARIESQEAVKAPFLPSNGKEVQAKSTYLKERSDRKSPIPEAKEKPLPSRKEKIKAVTPSEEKTEDISKAISKWVDPEGGRWISIEDWKKRQPKPKPFRIRKIYSSRPISGARLRPDPDRPEATIPWSKRFFVIVEPELISALAPRLDRYANDLEDEGYSSISVYASSGGEPSDLRAFLQGEYSSPERLAGCLFVGDLPIAWYEESYNPGDGSPCIHWPFPIDYYYMDLDGEWLDNQEWDDDDHCFVPGSNDFYDTYYGDKVPEIYVGRLTPSTLCLDGSYDEVDLLRGYFDRDHLYRTGSLPLSRRASVYSDNGVGNYENRARVWAGVLSDSFDEVITVTDPDTTQADHYLGTLEDPFNRYDWVSLCAHGSSGAHTFYFSEGHSPWRDFVYSSDIRDCAISPYFFYLASCSTCSYVEDNYIGGWYIFGNTQGLTVIGPTGLVCPIEIRDTRAKRLGEILLEARSSFYINSWMKWAILGDPTLGIVPGPDIKEVIITPSPPILEEYGAGEVEFKIIFNKRMDNTVPPTISYDPAGPTGPQACTTGVWSTTYLLNDTYTVYNVNPITAGTGDGMTHVVVSARDYLGNHLEDGSQRFLIRLHRGSTIYVDDDATSDMENGSPEYPYNTITEAAVVSLGGDRIMVLPGIYSPSRGEILPLEIKEEVNLIGSGASQTIIDGELPVEYLSIIGADGHNNISGFTITNSGQGINLKEGDSYFYELKIERNLFCGLGTAIYCDAREAGICNNTIVDCNRGIAAEYNSGEDDEWYLFLSNNIVANTAVAVSLYVEDEIIDERREGDTEIICNDFWDNEINYTFNDEEMPDPVGSDGNISGHPLFVALMPYYRDYHLQTGSPCIDTGDPYSHPDPDGTWADMGAFYFDQRIYVDEKDGHDYYDGLSPTYTWDLTGPKKTIQAGIEAAQETGRTICFVASGTYSGSTNGESFPIRIENGVELIGAGADKTIIEGNGIDPVIETRGDASIEGFTITNGTFGISHCWPDALLEVRRNVFHTIVTRPHFASGIAIYVRNGDAQVINNTIVDCVVGILPCSGSSIEAVNNIISDYEIYGFKTESGSTIISRYNDVWSVSGHGYYGCAPGEGDISEDPLLRPNYHLSVFCSSPASMPGDIDYERSSPGLDAGTRDTDGDGIIDIYNYELLAPDMGAFEYKLLDWTDLMKIE